jgi:signal transduction histidine kinase
VNLLTNPMAIRLAILAGLVFFMIAMVSLAILMVRVRHSIHGAGKLERPSAESQAFALSAFQDVIRQLKEQEQELKRLRDSESARAAATENVSAAVLANLTSGVLLFNPAGLVQQANPAARTILGFASPSGLHAREIFKTVSAVRRETGEKDSETALALAVEKALQNNKATRRLEADYETPQNEHRVIGVTVSPVGGDGKTIGAACLVSDLTDISQLQQQVRMRESLAALGEMSAGIAHEFKNSLATISGYAQMLANENDPPVVHEFAAKINQATANLSRVVSDFLDFARPHDMHTEPVPLEPVLRDCAAECGLELTVPDELREAVLIGDRTTLRQAFSNLFRNSAEASREGMSVRVDVEGEWQGPMLKLTVSDNGAGIPSEALDKVFIPFFTLKSAGTGIGLALVHRIVTEHGGSISVASDGSGTAFTLLLPAQKPAKAAAE